MGQGGFRLLLAMGFGLIALAATGTAGAAQSCGSRLLDDWRDGRIDGTYPVACYRQALAHMPEDVRVYSTAQADITRALPAKPVDVGVEGTRMSLTCGSARFSLPTMAVEDYPALPEMPSAR